MSDLTIDLAVTTPDIGSIVGDLTLADADAEVVYYDPGDVTKRRQTDVSATVRGGLQRSSVPDKRVLRLGLRIKGASKAALDANVQTWLNVFNQDRYQLTITINTVDTTWSCDDADYGIVSENGEGVDKYRLMASPLRQIYEFRIPTDPDPIAGVI